MGMIMNGLLEFENIIFSSNELNQTLNKNAYVMQFEYNRMRVKNVKFDENNCVPTN